MDDFSGLLVFQIICVWVECCECFVVFDVGLWYLVGICEDFGFGVVVEYLVYVVQGESELGVFQNVVVLGCQDVFQVVFLFGVDLCYVWIQVWFLVLVIEFFCEFDEVLGVVVVFLVNFFQLVFIVDVFQVFFDFFVVQSWSIYQIYLWLYVFYVFFFFEFVL